MGILDGIVEWIAEQVMNILDLIYYFCSGCTGMFHGYFSPVFFQQRKQCTRFFWHWLSDSSFLNWVWQLF